ncbi:MAG: sugar phosphate isomerase/epimerase [Bacteroidales bacterium]|jgi:sugar phosphate isomerase/epimerase|nr:sugar phosphate isomerase/epimerase [Bacteroidales bacterium]
MTNRRDFLKKASMLVASGVIGGSILSSCGGSGSKGAASKTPKKHVGLQLYSLRDDVNDLTIRKVLEIVAQMGYVNLETAGYNDGKIYGTDPAEFKKMVDDLGMRVTSAHLGRNLSDNRSDDMNWWNKAVEAHAAAGMKYMIMPSSPLDGEGATLDNVKRYGEYFNEIGLITAGVSMTFGYHNHAFEFKNKIDDTPVYDLLLENTSPDHVIFENDVYWTQVGGYNPVDYMKKYPQRIKVLHIKDEKAIGASGTMDFKAIFDQAYASGVKDWYVEVERYDGTPQEDVKKSYDFLAAADYVK